MQLHRDANGTPFLLLAGPEPDVQWERFIAAVFIVVERVGIRLTVGLHSVPWAAPHTRPIAVTSHGRPRELLRAPPLGIGKVRVPASVGHLLEYRLGIAGHAAIGFAAHTPYYLSSVEYPAATVSLLESVERAAGLSLALDPLRSRAVEVQLAIDSQVAGDERVRSVVRDARGAGRLGSPDTAARSPERRFRPVRSSARKSNVSSPNGHGGRAATTRRRSRGSAAVGITTDSVLPA